VLNAQQGAENDYLNGLSSAWERWLALNQNAGAGGGGPSPGSAAYTPAPYNQTTGGLPQTVSDTSSPLYGQPNPLFNSGAAAKLMASQLIGGSGGPQRYGI